MVKPSPARCVQPVCGLAAATLKIGSNLSQSPLSSEKLGQTIIRASYHHETPYFRANPASSV